ncbi:MAG: hypothetical protein ACI4TS_03605 [Bacteroidaceae bacterium]
MAVLKRGDKPEALNLNAARRFAESFGIAWNIICTKSGEILSCHWLSSMLAGLVGCCWLYVYTNTMFWHKKDWRELSIDLIAGALLLLVWSVMRIQQMPLLVENREKTSSKSVLKQFLGNIRKPLKSFFPLVLIWAIVFIAGYMLVACDVAIYITLPVVFLSTILLFPLAAMTQSYMEVSDGKWYKLLYGGFKLNGRYYGGMFALCFIALLFLLIFGVILYFGEVMIVFLFQNQSRAFLMGEEIDLPWHVVVWKYLFMFLATMIFSLLQVIWSMPQQIHIRSVVFKSKRRLLEKQKEDDVEKKS